jgi:hypothetical protein
MGARSLAALGALLVAAACGNAAPRLTLRAGDAVPAAWLPAERAGSGSALVWVFKTQDCLSCEAFDFTLRRLQRTYGRTVPLGTVHVGHAEHANIPRDFFTARRVAVAAETRISPGDFRRDYGEVTLPALLAVRGGRIVWSSAVAGPEPLTEARLDTLLRGFAETGRPPVAR